MLLDTHTLLWWLDDRPTLGPRARERIGSEHEMIFVSAITAAEIAIKTSVGKLRAPADLESVLTASAFTPLPLSVRHGLRVRHLPRHHGDPFDRLLVAQAQCEGLSIVTGDKKLAAYDVAIIDARA